MVTHYSFLCSNNYEEAFKTHKQLHRMAAEGSFVGYRKFLNHSRLISRVQINQNVNSYTLTKAGLCIVTYCDSACNSKENSYKINYLTTAGFRVFTYCDSYAM